MIEVAAARARCSQNVDILNRATAEATAKFTEIAEQRVLVQNSQVSIESTLSEKWSELEVKVNASFSAAHVENQSVKEFVQATEERIRRTCVA